MSPDSLEPLELALEALLFIFRFELMLQTELDFYLEREKPRPEESWLHDSEFVKKSNMGKTCVYVDTDHDHDFALESKFPIACFTNSTKKHECIQKVIVI